MRRHAVLGDLVHFLRTDLDFDRLPRFTDDRRMQRLIHIRFRHRDIIFEPIRQRFPQAVDDPQNRITLRNRVNDHASRVQIVNLTDILMFFLDFFVNTVKMFRTTADVRFDTVFLQ